MKHRAGLADTALKPAVSRLAGHLPESDPEIAMNDRTDTAAPPSGHQGAMDVGPSEQPGAPIVWGSLSAQFVRYPGCQQLQVWLPRAGWLGYSHVRVRHADGRLLVDASVRELLQGELHLLFDTLAWPPGAMQLEIGHVDGWQHTLALRKSDDGTPPAMPQSAARADPGDDLALRERELTALAGRLSRRLAYRGNARAGVVTLIEGERRIDFPHEMGGGDVGMVVDLPTVDTWTARTGLPLSRRDETIDFLARTLQREQASSWRFEIRPDCILYFCRPPR